MNSKCCANIPRINQLLHTPHSRDCRHYKAADEIQLLEEFARLQYALGKRDGESIENTKDDYQRGYQAGLRVGRATAERECERTHERGQEYE